MKKILSIFIILVITTLGYSQTMHHFSNIEALRSAVGVCVGDAVQTLGFYAPGDGGGATYNVLQYPPVGYTPDSVAVIPICGGWAVMDESKGVDIRAFGAKDNVPFIARQSPAIVNFTPIWNTSSDAAICAAIRYAAAKKLPNSGANNTVYIRGNFLVMDSTINVPNGVQIYCEGASFVHANHNRPLFVLDRHFSTTHRIKATHGMVRASGTTVGIDWYAKGQSTQPDDSTSIGIFVLNSRNVTINDIELFNFRHGLELRGETQGTVENQFTIHRIFNCKWGVFIDGNNNGWAHQNTFTGGAIKLIGGTTDRNRAVEIECGAIYTNGDNCLFQNINLEGSTHYKYAIYTNASSNHFYNCRYEGVRANQIFFTVNARDNKISGSYGFNALKTRTAMPLFYSADGVTPVPAHGNPIAGNTDGYIIELGGSLQLGGGSSSQGFNNVENKTLSIGTRQAGHESVILFETKTGNPESARTSFEINGKGEVNYWGGTNTTGVGKSLKKEWADRGVVIADKTYIVGSWYSRGDFVNINGTSYMVSYPFQATTNHAAHLSAGAITPNSGRETPIVAFTNSGLYADRFIGRIPSGATYIRPPVFSNGLALSAFSEDAITISSAQTLPTAGRSGYILRSTAGQTTALNLDPIGETSGHIFYLYNRHNVTDTIKVLQSTRVVTLDGRDIMLPPGGLSMFIVMNYAGQNAIREIARSSLLLERSGVHEGATDENGDIMIMHGLGVLPSNVSITPLGELPIVFSVVDVTATHIKVRVFQGINPLVNSQVKMSWTTK